jgi:hypothetical protein
MYFCCSLTPPQISHATGTSDTKSLPAGTPAKRNCRASDNAPAKHSRRATATANVPRAKKEKAKVSGFSPLKEFELRKNGCNHCAYVSSSLFMLSNSFVFLYRTSSPTLALFAVVHIAGL